MSKFFVVSLTAVITATSLFAGEKVTIGAYQNYPTPSCKIGEKYYLIPNGTSAEVIKWGGLYTDGKDKDLYAQIDMYTESEVKLLNGPQKGKTCTIEHVYMQLK